MRVVSPSSRLETWKENEDVEDYEGEILFLPEPSSDERLNRDLSLLSIPSSSSSSVSSSRYIYLLPSSSSSTAGDSTDYATLDNNRDGQETNNTIDQEKKKKSEETRSEKETKNAEGLPSSSLPPTLLRIKAERQCVFRGKIDPPLENVKISFLKSSSSSSHGGSRSIAEKKGRDSSLPSSFYTGDVLSDKNGRFVSDVFRCRDSPLVEQEKGEEEKRQEKLRYEDLLKDVSIEAVYQGYSFVREDLTRRLENRDTTKTRRSKDTDIILLKAIK